MTKGREDIPVSVPALQANAERRPGAKLGKLFFPPKCVFCGKMGKEFICGECLDKLPKRSGPAKQRGFFSECAAPFRYEGKAKFTLLNMKFHGRLTAARGFAPYMAEAALRESDGFDLITYVPSDIVRSVVRGYNPARVLARETAACLGIKCAATLVKTRLTARQSTLNRPEKREANVLGAFRTVRRVKGRRILLVDDIVTTGATLSECARQLRLAGAENVSCVAAAARDNMKKSGL